MSFLLLAVLAAAPASADSVAFGRFVNSVVWKPEGEVKGAAIILAPFKREGANDVAKALNAQGAFVVVTDGSAWVKQLEGAKDKCLYPAAELEALSQKAQEDAGLSRYFPPTLIAFGGLGTLAYASIAQGPPNTFEGAIFLDLCPSIPVNKPICPGRAFKVEKGAPVPSKALTEQWTFLARKDARCHSESFSSQMANATVTKVETTEAEEVAKAWTARYVPQAVALSAAPTGDASVLPEVSDLPIIEVPSDHDGELLAIIVSGDGGWASIDKSIAESLSKRGVGVVGLNALQFFWHRKTPEESAAAVQRIAERYLSLWKRKRVVLIGFSRGADVVPFIANRLPDALRSKLDRVALLSPGKKATFEFHVSDWISGSGEEGELDVKPEAEKVSAPLVCAYGKDEAKESLCPGLSAAKKLPFEGGHHLDGKFDELAEQVMAGADAGTH
ncbi:MAG: AcvB/VirJ family lysyl-phosphatidylglycerol hydrolase [Myxococcaceae bacterium]